MTVYADNAATTKMSQTALNAMLPAMEENFGNPSSLHSVGQRAAELLMKSRETVARCLNCQPREIIFTSGGSEADNQALLSAAAIGRRKGKMHIISTAFEHHAILHTLKKLEKEGFEVELLPVHENGMVSAQQVADAIREDTCLVTVMYANNEIGSILPIEEIGAVCRLVVCFCVVCLRVVPPVGIRPAEPPCHLALSAARVVVVLLPLLPFALAVVLPVGVPLFVLPVFAAVPVAAAPLAVVPVTVLELPLAAVASALPAAVTV